MSAFISSDVCKNADYSFAKGAALTDVSCAKMLIIHLRRELL